MKTAIITGAGGFVGSHLTEHLLKKSIKVTAIVHPKHSDENLKNVKSKISITKIDLTNKKSLKKIYFKDADYIFHLAAFSSPAESFKDPASTLKNNIFSQLNLLEHLTSINCKAKILIVGSADEYGNVDKKNLPVNESTPLAPNSPYAVSKVAQDILGYQFFTNYGLLVVRVRPFNHIGPRQSTHFVVPSFASQIAKIEKERRGYLKVGHLNTWRDFTDVRDIVKGYLLALDKGVKGEVYNLGSGRAIRIADILSKLISFSKEKIKVVEDKKLLRPTDISKIYCDFSKIHEATGWTPEISIDQTLFDTIEYERSKLLN